MARREKGEVNGEDTDEGGEDTRGHGRVRHSGAVLGCCGSPEVSQSREACRSRLRSRQGVSEGWQAMKRDIARLRRTQGCLTDCVAYYFNVHPERVPLFIYPRGAWIKRLRRFFRARGYTITWRDILFAPIPATGAHIVCGDSLVWKMAAHCVVYRNGKMVYDPNFPSQWKKQRITHRLIVRKAKGYRKGKETR